MTQILEPGTLVETTRAVLKEYDGIDTWPAGTQFTIEDYVAEKESEDGVPFYWGSRNGGVYNIYAPADAVNMVKSAVEMNAPTIPTRAQIIDALGSALLCSGDGFSINETGKNPGYGTIECAGKTDEGLHFAFTIVLPEPHETDF